MCLAHTHEKNVRSDQKDDVVTAHVVANSVMSSCFECIWLRENAEYCAGPAAEKVSRQTKPLMGTDHTSTHNVQGMCCLAALWAFCEWGHLLLFMLLHLVWNTAVYVCKGANEIGLLVQY
jgi:hypothetical protein